MKFFKIGELSKEAGITVRTLRHYDQIGLLQASAGSESGHRLYKQQDLERLQQIISLKSMGLSLDQIMKCLNDDAYDLLKVFKMQETAISSDLENLKKIQKTLLILIHKLNQDQKLTTKQLLSFMKEVKTMEKYYTADQIKYLHDRYDKFEEKAKAIEKAWPLLFKKFEEAMKAGLPINDLKVQVLASEAQLYIDLFTGGDREIEMSMDKNFSENYSKMWKISKEVFEYMDRVRKSLKVLRK